MNLKKAILPLIVASALGGLAIPAQADVPPPLIRYEVAPPPPAAPGAVWQEGRWSWNGDRYVWVDGHWVRRDGYYAYAPRPWDRDADGVPNRADRDIDGDGVPNRFDRAPYNPNWS